MIWKFELFSWKSMFRFFMQFFGYDMNEIEPNVIVEWISWNLILLFFFSSQFYFICFYWSLRPDLNLKVSIIVELEESSTNKRWKYHNYNKGYYEIISAISRRFWRIDLTNDMLLFPKNIIQNSVNCKWI